MTVHSCQLQCGDCPDMLTARMESPLDANAPAMARAGVSPKTSLPRLILLSDTTAMLSASSARDEKFKARFLRRFSAKPSPPSPHNQQSAESLDSRHQPPAGLGVQAAKSLPRLREDESSNCQDSGIQTTKSLPLPLVSDRHDEKFSESPLRPESTIHHVVGTGVANPAFFNNANRFVINNSTFSAEYRSIGEYIGILQGQISLHARTPLVPSL